MATAKKASATKKTRTTKPKTAKTSTKAAPARKKTVVKTVAAKPAAAPKPGFFSFNVTRESIYWLILVMAVLALGVWVVNLTDKVNRDYDEIEATQTESSQVKINR